MSHLRPWHWVHRCNCRASAQPSFHSRAIGALIFAASFAAASGALAQASSGTVHQHAHVHGTAKLDIAVQGQTVTISLESPLESLIGFEHRPRSASERSAVASLQARMKAPRDLFRFNLEAGCSLVKAEAESAIFDPAPASVAADEHADLDASFEFACAQPAKLIALDIGLFKTYPKLRKLGVQVATDKGQSRQTLTGSAHVVSLSR